MYIIPQLDTADSSLNSHTTHKNTHTHTHTCTPVYILPQLAAADSLSNSHTYTQAHTHTHTHVHTCVHDTTARDSRQLRKCPVGAKDIV